MNVNQWCKEHEINSKTYYRWEREVLGIASKKLTEAEPVLLAAKTEFAVIPETMHPTIQMAAILQIGGFRVEIQNGADSVTVEAIITALRSC